jgi:16S rRNA (cytosine967-C5)-methyltransferase
VIAPARRAAFAALVELAGGRRDLADVLDGARRTLVDPRDVALLQELVVGTMRWQSRLDAAIAQLSRVPLDKLDRDVLLTLRLGTYQLLFLDRVPAAAAVNDSVALVRTAKKSSAAGLVNAVLRRVAAGEGRGLPARPTGAVAAERAAWVAHLAAVHAHPPWLVERWLAREPLEVVERWLAYDNAAPEVALRVNPLVASSRSAAVEALSAEGIEAVPSPRTPWGLRVEHGAAATSAALAAGMCLIQDEGSQLAGLLAPVAPGQRVLDVCGAPGGKALIYAAAAGPGLVIAGDARAARVTLLAATLRRGHADRARVVHLDPEAPLPFSGSFDVVVVDAPCSGLGTLRRDPDIKWRRTAADLPQLAARQLDLVRRAGAVVVPGGRLVYTTCSTEPEENEEVVARALEALPEFQIARDTPAPEVAPFVGDDGRFRTRPGRDGLDGYFGVVLARTGRPLAPGEPL